MSQGSIVNVPTVNLVLKTGDQVKVSVLVIHNFGCSPVKAPMISAENRKSTGMDE